MYVCVCMCVCVYTYTHNITVRTKKQGSNERLSNKHLWRSQGYRVQGSEMYVSGLGEGFIMLFSELNT